MKPNKSIWNQMAGYAGGGETDDEEEGLDPSEEYQVATPGEGMRELASQMLRGVPRQPNDAATMQPVVEPHQVVPASSQGNVLDVREKLQEFLGKQAGGSDKMQELADLYKGQLAKEGKKNDLSGLNALADYYYGTNFAKTFAKPPTAREQTEANMRAQEGANKSRQPVTADLLKEYGSDNNAVGKEQANYYRGLNNINKEQLQGIKDAKNLDKMEDDMGKAMNPMSSVYGAGSNNLGQRLAKARSVMALVAQHPNYELDPREQKDLALGMASLITNQNRVPYELVESLVPKTFKGNVAKWSEYLSNHPESTESQEFVKRMVQTVGREQNVASKQIQAIQSQQAERFNHLARSRPQRHQQLMKSGGNYISMPELDLAGGDDQPQTKTLPDGSSYQRVDGKWHKVKKNGK